MAEGMCVGLEWGARARAHQRGGGGVGGATVVRASAVERARGRSCTQTSMSAHANIVQSYWFVQAVVRVKRASQASSCWLCNRSRRATRAATSPNNNLASMLDDHEPFKSAQRTASHVECQAVRTLGREWQVSRGGPVHRRAPTMSHGERA